MRLVSETCLILTVLIAVGAAYGQEPVGVSLPPVAATAATEVPRLVSYSGVAAGIDGKALTGEMPVSFFLYRSQQGGEPLWSETQVVPFDVSGRYEVKLGAGARLGLPVDTFASGEGRWLEVQIAGQQAQPRVLLVSVPYAMKAADAATLGGLPASAFALASSTTASLLRADGIAPDAASNVTTTGGTSFYVPKFNAAATVINSQIYDNGTSVGIGDVPNPSAKLDVNGAMIMRGNMQVTRTGNATASKGDPSWGFQFYSNAYNSSTKANDNPYFQLQSEPTGNNTASPSATFNLLFSNNGSVPTETGLYINPNGTVHFASGQTYPGAAVGTITGVTAGTALTGGGTSGNVTLNVDATKVPLLASANSFTAAQTIGVGSSSGLTALTATGPYGISGVSNDYGIGVAGSGGYLGVQGMGVVYGVYGQGIQVDGVGVYGVGGGPSSIGLGLGAGVVGRSNVGVIGYTDLSAPVGSNGTYPITAGVYAQAGSQSTIGSEYTFPAALYADGGAVSAGGTYSQIAVYGTTDVETAGYFHNMAGANQDAPTVIADNSAGGDLFYAYGGPGNYCSIDGTADLACSGTISGSNVTADNRALTTYGVQATENWYEDAGSGQLQNGAAHIALDPSFGAVVNTEVEYHVFLTPNGEANTLYVTNKTASGFDVRENGHGTSSIAFDYRIMAKRKGYEAVRLEDVTEKLKERRERQAKMQRKGARGLAASTALKSPAVTPATR